jgi:4-phytase/acid phosphatase
MRSPLLIAFGWLLLVASVPAQTPPSTSEGADEVKLVVILTRHGVRTPILHNEVLDRYSAQPWPTWEVPPSNLTPHGKRQMVMLGAYYRRIYTAAGVLSGDSARDLTSVYFRSDSDQRTIETARDLAAGLVPGAQPEIHARPLLKPDPLFTPTKLPVGNPDFALGQAAVLGRLGGDPSNVLRACAPEFSVLRDVLFGPGGAVPADRVWLLDVPSRMSQGLSDTSASIDHLVDINGGFHRAEQIVDGLMLEYADGKPMSEVGWGRMTPAALTQLIRLHSLYFDLTQHTLYPAQVQGSNLASHLLKTLQQAAGGAPDAGALAPPAAKLLMVVGHDTNIINLTGLLGATWWLPGTQEDPVLPGGALVFELRQGRAEAAWRVRTYYVSQTLDQMRAGLPLTPDNPPYLAPVFIPGCSGDAPGFDAPLPAFEALLQRVIDPRFVLPSSL